MRFLYFFSFKGENAQVAELVDAHVSGACVERRAGSTPVLGTNKRHEASNIINVPRLKHF